MPQLHLTKFVQPGQFCHVAASVMNGLERSGEHSHDFLEAFWCDRGRGWHFINGVQRPLSPGSLFLVRADDSHCFSGTAEQSLRIVNVAFPITTWTYLRDRYLIDSDRYWSDVIDEHRERQLSPAQMAELARHAAELQSGARSQEAIERFLMNLIALLRSIDHAQPVANLPAWLDRACKLIAQPEHFQLGTNGLAELAGKSPEHVARAARRYLNTTPTAIVNEARMTYAAERLTSSSDDILDLCADCGFENLSHFYALFRQRWGVPPKRYRQQQQGIVTP